MTYNFPSTIVGDTFPGVQFTVLVNGTGLDLNGAYVDMMVKENVESPCSHSYNTLNTGLSILTASSGIFAFNPQIITLPANQYVYDIKFDLNDGTVRTYISGSFFVVNA